MHHKIPHMVGYPWKNGQAWWPRVHQMWDSQIERLSTVLPPPDTPFDIRTGNSSNYGFQEGGKRLIGKLSCYS